jgi:hypothetical protein
MLSRYLQEAFGVDVRSLALLRIAIALVVMFNLVMIANELGTFYSESGVLPVELSQQVSAERGEGFWSLLWLSGSSNWAYACLGIAAVASLALLLGFFTTASTAICLVMMWSFQIRNPLVLTAGDILLRMVLVWGLFLPWGRVWSLDGRNERRKSNQVTSFASAGLLLQLACVYFFSGIAKYNGDWSGTALVQTLNLEMYVNTLGSWLESHTEVLNKLALGVVVIEIGGPILMFLPWVNQYFRGAMMALMWIMHLMIALTMSIGIFSVVAAVTWIAFIPGSVWKPFLGCENPLEKASSGDGSPHWLTQCVCAALLLFVLLLNVDKIGAVRGRLLPVSADNLASRLMIQQEFKMFAHPPTSSPWPHYVGTLGNGELVDLFQKHDHAYTGQKPESVFRYMRSQFWRRYHFNLIHPSGSEPVPPIYQELRKRLLGFQVQDWNRNVESSRYVSKAKMQMHFDEFSETGKPNGNSTQQTWAEYLAN